MNETHQFQLCMLIHQDEKGVQQYPEDWKVDFRLQIALDFNVNVFVFTWVHLKGDRRSPRAANCCQLGKYIRQGLLYVSFVLVLFFRCP